MYLLPSLPPLQHVLAYVRRAGGQASWKGKRVCFQGGFGRRRAGKQQNQRQQMVRGSLAYLHCNGSYDESRAATPKEDNVLS